MTMDCRAASRARSVVVVVVLLLLLVALVLVVALLAALKPKPKPPVLLAESPTEEACSNAGTARATSDVSGDCRLSRSSTAMED
jgi:hypothetical protein